MVENMVKEPIGEGNIFLIVQSIFWKFFSGGHVESYLKKEKKLKVGRTLKLYNTDDH